MKKLLFLFTLLITVLAGCNAESAKPQETKSETSDIVTFEKETKENVVTEIQFAATDKQDKQTLMEILKSSADVEEEGGFINKVAELTANPDKKEYIAIYVNEEMALQGASDLRIQKGDVVSLKLETWE